MTTQHWDENKVSALYERPFSELLFAAHLVHKENFNAQEVELCTLLSIKTGSCPEDCAYCPQSAHYQTGVRKEKLLELDAVLNAAKRAKENGATRFCMGAAWRNPPAKQFPAVLAMVRAVKEIGLETCLTLGMLSADQAQELKSAGLDFYNHNLDTSAAFYSQIISTRTYQDRLDTLGYVHDAGINMCCGGIIGMGESRKDRIGLLLQLVNLPAPPTSVPINRLIPFAGTPLAQTDTIDNFEFIRTIAVARIMLPASMIRLSAGRISMSEEMQAWCFFAGANSMWLGETLLTAANPAKEQDFRFLNKLGMQAKVSNA
jgi:biotin synthetase